jgi:PPM family protein phosphatase
MSWFWRKQKGSGGSQATIEQAKASQTSAVTDAGSAGGGQFEIRASVLSDVGCHREANEDFGSFVRPGDAEVRARKGVLALVADGMGGHSAGEVASKMAGEVITRSYYDAEGVDGSALAAAVEEANRRIYETARTDERLQGMGTTCTALVLQNGSALCAHVGDSRLYLVRNAEIYLMTQDDSEVMEMVRRGLISREEARNHEDRNVIFKAVGSSPEVEVSTWEESFPVRDGDRFLLCSDGLHDLVEDSEIKDAVISGDPRAACESLVALARQRGGFDNITVAVLAVEHAKQEDNPDIRQTRDLKMAV